VSWLDVVFWTLYESKIGRAPFIRLDPDENFSGCCISIDRGALRAFFPSDLCAAGGPSMMCAPSSMARLHVIKNGLALPDSCSLPPVTNMRCDHAYAIEWNMMLTETQLMDWAQLLPTSRPTSMSTPSLFPLRTHPTRMSHLCPRLLLKHPLLRLHP
jgi:hypothetical protein